MEKDVAVKALLDKNMALLRDKDTRHLANFSFMKSNVIHIQVPLKLAPLSCKEHEFELGGTEIEPGVCARCSNIECKDGRVRMGECGGIINGFTCVREIVCVCVWV